MTEPTWVPFTAADQAQPGRRMRMAEYTPSIYTVDRTGLHKRRHHVFFKEGGALGVAWLRRQRWQIEV